MLCRVNTPILYAFAHVLCKHLHRHEIVGTAVKVGSKVEKNIKSVTSRNT